VNKLAFDIGNSFFDGNHFLTNLPGLGQLVSILLTNAVTIAGVVFLFLIIIGGFEFITGAGSAEPQRVARGREIIIAAIIGFIIVIASYWIVLIVGKATGTNLLK
jgi:hypothetical protein